MHIKHNCKKVGLSFQELTTGETYLSLNGGCREPRVYIACRRACADGGGPPDFLVNLRTGSTVIPAHQIRYKHLPNATLDTGE